MLIQFYKERKQCSKQKHGEDVKHFQAVGSLPSELLSHIFQIYLLNIDEEEKKRVRHGDPLSLEMLDFPPENTFLRR